MFQFNDQLYLQTYGTAMGTKFAPSFANIYMGGFEETYIYHKHNWSDNIIMYKRFIDDLIFIWKGEEKDFADFTKYLNTNSWGLTLSGDISSVSIDYLDVTLTNEGTRIITKNYYKSVDCNSLLDFNSCHYRKWLTNIPYGQFKRLRRNCTIDKDYRSQSNILKNRLKEKKYPSTIINYAYKKAGNLTQLQCIQPRAPTQDMDTINPFKNTFVTTYNHEHRHIKNILAKHWHILKNDPHLDSLIPTAPRMIFRRAKTLKNILAPSMLKTKNKMFNNCPDTTTHIDQIRGNYRCKNKRCKCCINIAHGAKNITSNATGEDFEIKTRIDCDSSFVIYILKCNCGLQYVGRTSQKLRTRMNQHRSNVMKGYIKHSVSRHAATNHDCNFNHFSISAIEQIGTNVRNRHETLAKREMYWIFKFDTLVPKGLNEALEHIY